MADIFMDEHTKYSVIYRVINWLVPKNDKVDTDFKKALKSTARRLEELHGGIILGGNLEGKLLKELPLFKRHFKDGFAHLKEPLNKKLQGTIYFKNLLRTFCDDLIRFLIEELEKYDSTKPLLVQSLRDFQSDQTNEGVKEIKQIVLERLPEKTNANLALPIKQRSSYRNPNFISRGLQPFNKESHSDIPNKNLLQLVEENLNKRIVVLGIPGQGKTEEFSFLYSKLSDEANNFFPIKINLGNEFDTNCKLEDILDGKIENWTQIPRENLVLIFDGYDELTSEAIQNARVKINRLAGSVQLQSSTIIVGGRNNSYNYNEEYNHNDLESFEVFLLPPFTWIQVDEYLTKRISNHQKEQTFLQQLRVSKFDSDGCIPFYLVHLVDYFEENNDKLPNSTVALFEFLISKQKSVEELKAKFRGLNFIEFENEFDESMIKLAFVQQCMDQNYIGNDILMGVIPDSNTRAYVKSISLLNREANERWSFGHNNLKEYLAAKFLLRLDFDKVRGLLFIEQLELVKPKWLNVMGFYFHIVEKDNYVFEKLLYYVLSHDPESLIRIDSDKIPLSVREQAFDTIFAKYADREHYPKSPKFTIDELAKWVENSQDLCKLYIEKLAIETPPSEFDTYIYLLARNKYYVKDKSDIEERLKKIILHDTTPTKVFESCFHGLREMEIVEKDLILLFLKELDFDKAHIKECLYRYIKNSPYFEHFFEQVFDWYLVVDEYKSQFKYGFLHYLKKPDSFYYILKNAEKLKRKGWFGSHIPDTIDKVIQLNINDDRINELVFENFSSEGLSSWNYGSMEIKMVEYIDFFELRNAFFKRMTNEYVRSNNERLLHSLAMILHPTNVEYFISSLKSMQLAHSDAKSIRNILSFSKEKTSFEQVYNFLNEVFNNELLWDESREPTVADVLLKSIDFLFARDQFVEFVIANFLSDEGQIINDEYLAIKHQPGLKHNIDFNATIRILGECFDPDMVSEIDFLGYVNNDHEWDILKASFIKDAIFNELDRELGERETQFVHRWSQNVLDEIFKKETLYELDYECQRYSYHYLAIFFIYYFKMKISEGLLKALVNLNSFYVPIVNKGDKSDFDDQVPSFPLIEYVVEQKNTEFVVTVIIDALTSNHIFEDVKYCHLKHLRSKNRRDLVHLFLMNADGRYMYEIVKWYIELGGDLEESLNLISKLESIEVYSVYNEIIKRNKENELAKEKDMEILIPFLVKKLETNSDPTVQIELIEYLLSCKSEIGLLKLKDWIFSQKRYPIDFRVDLFYFVKSERTLEVLIEIVSFSIESGFDNLMNSWRNENYFSVIKAMGVKSHKNYQLVREFMVKYINSASHHKNLLTYELENLDFNFFTQNSPSIALNAALEIIEISEPSR